MKSAFAKLITLLLVVLIIVEVFNINRPLPSSAAALDKLPSATGPAANLPWPAAEAAIGTKSDGVLASHGGSQPLPTASVAKVITALAVLKTKPIPAGQQGAPITLTATDVGFYQKYVSEDGSVVPVQAGEQITEYEALQAMMLPSANNIAESLAVWAFGSLPAYTSYANNFVKELGMTGTTVSDASGFSPQTVSTASDLVKLGQAALHNPVLADIISQRLANTPNFGTLYNLNFILGQDGIIGIKTGNTNQAGGCYLVAAQRTVHGSAVTVIAAVLGDASLIKAMHDGHALINASDSQFQSVIIKKGEVVGKYKTAWGQQTEAVTKENIELLAWRGQPINTRSDLRKLSTASAGDNVGSVKVSAGAHSTTVPVILKSNLTKPSLTWRLTHF